MYKNRKTVSLLLILVMMLSLFPAVNAAQTIDVTLPVTTDTTVTDSPAPSSPSVSAEPSEQPLPSPSNPPVSAEPSEQPVPSPTASASALMQAIDGAAGWIYTQQNGFAGNYETGDDWDIFALSRSGKMPDADAQFNYVNALKAYVDDKYEQEGKLSLPSDYARIALSVNALGLDATNFGGINLIEAIYNNDGMSSQGINGYVYALLALDSKNYEIPSDALWTRDRLIDAIIALQKEEGYFVIQDDWGVDNDLTAAVVQTLAPYYSQDKVKTSVDSALTWLSGNQSDNAGYESWGSENSQTPSQVITALSALGRNPLTDSDFVKQNKTLLENVLTFANEDGGFDYSPSYPGSNAMATQQVLYSLSALQRYQNNHNRLYDLTDADTTAGNDLLGKLTAQINEAKNAQSRPALVQAIADAEQITESSTKCELFNASFALSAALQAPPQPSPSTEPTPPQGGGTITNKTASIKVTANTIGKGTVFAQTTFTISTGETPYSLLVKALGQSAVETTGSGDSAYVAAIKHNNVWIRELQYGAGSGWMYRVNGDYKQESCGTYQLQSGDVLEWIYTIDTGNDIGGYVGGGTIRVSPKPSPSPKPVNNTYKETLDTINSGLSQKEFLSEWEIFALSTQGKSASGVQALIDSVTEANGNYRKVTDLERNALALASAGIDITDVNGINLIEKMCNHENMTMQGVNGPAYALIVLDSMNYDVPDGSKWNRESLIEFILSAQNEDGGFALEPGKESNIDVTAMALQALSPYQDKEQEKINKALSYLSSVQNEDGGYSLFGDENSESISQVIIALTSLGINPKEDSRFIKNGNSTIDALLTYYKDGAFSHSKCGQADKLATEQGLLALTAYDKFLNGNGKLFDIKTVPDSYRDISSASAWAKDAIDKADKYGIMQGYDGYFNPQNNLTRVEFTAIIVRMMNLKADTIDNPFGDISENDWYYESVLAAYQAGLIKGQSENTFAPLENISREEMAVVLSRALSLKSDDADIADIDSASSWAQDSIKAVFAGGIMQGYDGYFNPHDYVTREMAAVVCVRIYENFLN